GEIGLHVLQLRLPPALVWCLPVLHGDVLRFAPWRAGDPLVSNRYGIPEPDVEPSSGLEAQDLALAVMPLVGFDARCQRLGMGGGWYDRSFAFLKERRRGRAAPPWLVGAGFAVQRVPMLEPAEWDIVPNAICTEESTLLRENAPA
ncbi:MAG TPA: 5-formyltetrahydrofolate cyclo-ligase, partial [Pseudoxanthomonas sp.]|nr:5-formyltetrahydrofolate cyclo-ligase [Pseudoxanthomonas sp.]